MTARPSELKAALVRRKVRMPVRLKNGSYRNAYIATFHGLCDGLEHLAILMSDWDRVEAPLVRIHSECLTGDVFASGRCDCGPQLQEALIRCDREGGLVLYLRQEGRGIGLYNKVDAYALQDTGMDTFEANQALDFKNDLRDYRPVAQMLGALKLKSVRLMTNNPDKVGQLRDLDIDIVEQLPTGVYPTSDNIRYLRTKREKAGHIIDLAAEPAATAPVGSAP